MACALLISRKYLQSPQRYASLDTRLPFAGRSNLRSPPHTPPPLRLPLLGHVCLCFGKHVTPVRGTSVANGPTPPTFCTCSAALFLTFCRSSICWRCEAANVQENKRNARAACGCVSAHRGYCAAAAAAAVVRTAVLQLSKWPLFLFMPPCSCHCCVWSEFAEPGTLGEVSDPPNYAECHSTRPAL